ncbi:MAG: hypothetical protein K2Y29_20230 [Beijerinckiaceae bacterium]|nr:hypothetical protein [Beijerinckiaceae bacterium]
MTHYDPNRPHTESSLPGARRSDDPLNPPYETGEPVIHDAAPVRTGDEARQAYQGRTGLYVLIAALVLALIAWAGVELYPRGGPQTAGPGPGDPATTATTRQPNAGGIPLSPPANAPAGNPGQGQTSPDSQGRGQTSAPSPSSDSAR